MVVAAPMRAVLRTIPQAVVATSPVAAKAWARMLVQLDLHTAALVAAVAAVVVGDTVGWARFKASVPVHRVVGAI